MKDTKPSADVRPDWKDLADKLAIELDADVYLFAGDMYSPADFQLMGLIPPKRRANAFLMMTTDGGSGDTAYRVAHHMQKAYSSGEVILFVPMQCKSAGTLTAVGAHQIVMADTAELGPLDVQISKVDEVGERHSGLTPTQTLNTLKNQAFNLFEHIFTKLRERFRLSTKMAASTSSEIVTGLLSPIYNQIDPMRLGEIERAMMVAAEYGDRLKTVNLKDNALTKLLTGYPSHGFVIDREEAATLFKDVRVPSTVELQLFIAAFPEIQDGQKAESARVLLLSSRLPPDSDNKEKGEKSNDTTTEPGPATESPGSEGNSPS